MTRKPTASTARRASSNGPRPKGHVFDFAIVGEPSATARVGDSIKIGRRGSLNGRITVTGIQGHVAYPHKALNPLPVAAALVGALSGTLDDGSAHFPASNLEFTSIDVGNTTTQRHSSRGESALQRALQRQMDAREARSARSARPSRR